MKVSAKCMNHSGCLKAYRGEIIELDPGAPLVCPECGKPLAKAGGGAGGAVKTLAIVAGVLVIAVGAVLGMKLMKKDGGTASDAEPTPIADVTPAPPVTPDTPPQEPPKQTTSVTPPSATPVVDTPPAPPPPPPVDEPPPAAPVATNETATDTVRKDVLTRIDKMPNMTPEKKDRLYISVERAKNMKKVVEVGFASGQSTMPPSSGPQVKKLLDSPEVMKMRDEPECVIVVLGFADGKGTPAGNLAISEKRAKSVIDFLESQGVRSVMHAVGMGGTDLVDKNNAAKNRIAEIWIVLP